MKWKTLRDTIVSGGQGISAGGADVAYSLAGHRQPHSSISRSLLAANHRINKDTRWQTQIQGQKNH